MTPTPRSELAPWLAALAAVLLWFLPLNAPHLFDPDEGRYAEIPREMVASGDWVTPRLDAIKYFEKPALQYWTTAIAYQLFGEHAWTVRLWPALCGFLGVLLTWWLARRLYDVRTAWLSALVQGGALLYIAFARITTLDMSLCFSLQLAMTALIGLTAPLPAPLGSRAGWPLLLGFGVALAVLTKGLVGILVPAAVGGLYMLITRDWRLLIRSQPWWTLAALALIVAPWFALVMHRNPEFFQFFFIFEHFHRYLSRTGIDRYQPFWFFVPVLALGFLPWTSLLPRALAEGWRAARGGERASTLLLIWSIFVLVFFSASQSKLIPYILPLLPSLALLTGRTLAALPARTFAAHLRGVAVFSGAIGLAVLIVWYFGLAPALTARASGASIAGFGAAFLLLGLGAAVALLWCRRGDVIAGAASAALGTLLFTQAGLLGAEQLPRMRALVDLTAQVKPQLTDQTSIYCVNQYAQPLPFYLKRPCTLVGYRGELDFGLTIEPWRAIPDFEGFAHVWREHHDELAIMPPRDYQTLESLGLPMRVIYTAPSLVAVVRP